MSASRSERREERREQIIDGALRVFSERGFTQASNIEIAKAAGIQSPGLIYHYFKNKEDLLRAVIERYAPPMQILANLDQLVDLPIEESLTSIARSYLQLMESPKIEACLKVLIVEALRSDRFALILQRIGPMRFFNTIRALFERKMDEGKLRRIDPNLAVWSFFGPFAARMLSKRILNLSEPFLPDGEDLIEAHISTFLRGMRND